MMTSCVISIKELFSIEYFLDVSTDAYFIEETFFIPKASVILSENYD